MKFPLRFLQLSGVTLMSLMLMGAELKPGDLALREAAFYRGEGQRLQKAGDLQSAETAYQKAILLNPGYAEAYNDLGVILESRGDTKGAESFYQRALQINPSLAAAHSNLGLLYERLGRMEEAGEHWTARVKRGPSNDPWVVSAREKLAKYNLSWEKLPEVAEGEKPVKKLQGLEEGRLDKGENRQEREQKRREERQRQKEEEERRREEEKRRKEQEKRVALETRLEEKRAQQKERETAQPLGSEAKRRRKDVAGAYEAGRRYLKARRWDDAEREFDRTLNLDPTHEGAIDGLKEVQTGRLRTLSGPPPSLRKEKAMEMALENAKLKEQVNPHSVPPPAPPPPPTPVPFSREAQVLAEQMTRQKAKSRQETIREIYQRGIVAMRQARYEEAVTSFQQILTLEPNQPDALQGLKRAQTALAKSKKL